MPRIIVFDTPRGSDAIIVAMAGWRKLISQLGPFQGKCVRFYTHSFLKNFTLLAGVAKKFTSGIADSYESPDKTVFLAYLAFEPGKFDNIWQHTFDVIWPGGSTPVNTFDFVHHAIPALCLTDAASRRMYI